MVWVGSVLLDGHGQLGVYILLFYCGLQVYHGVVCFGQHLLVIRWAWRACHDKVYKCGVDIAVCFLYLWMDFLRWYFQLVIYWPLNHGRYLTG